MEMTLAFTYLKKVAVVVEGKQYKCGGGGGGGGKTIEM